MLKLFELKIYKDEYYQDACEIKSLKLTSDLEITIRVMALLSDERPLNAFSKASAKNRGGLRVHRTKMTKNNEITVTNDQATS